MSPGLEDFRATVRQWCRAHVPADWRTTQTVAGDAEAVAFQKAWESGLHVYLKRAALNRSLFGSPAAHRAQLAQRYENWRR